MLLLVCLAVNGAADAPRRPLRAVPATGRGRPKAVQHVTLKYRLKRLANIHVRHHGSLHLFLQEDYEDVWT